MNRGAVGARRNDSSPRPRQSDSHAADGNCLFAQSIGRCIGCKCALRHTMTPEMRRILRCVCQRTDPSAGPAPDAQLAHLPARKTTSRASNQREVLNGQCALRRWRRTDAKRPSPMNRHASMNRAYRLIWSAVRGAWIAVAEKTRGRGKQPSRTLLAAAMSLGAAYAQAGGPSGGQVTAGTGSITQSGALTTIAQQSPKLSLTWTSFNIAPQQTVDFIQPSANSIAVNRIFDTNGSQILGHLDANGQVFLINPNGILFGPGAQVNVGGLVASTLDISEASLDTTARSFTGSSTASVVNEGTINAAAGGYVALLGSRVSNKGAISAQLGTVALGAGSAATLTFSNNSLLHLQVDQSVWRSVAANGGLIRADGGQVIMTAGARDALLASVVNNTGVIEARTVGTHDGNITLLAGMTTGTVDVGGTLDASAPHGGNGGFIETSGAHVEVATDAKVTTAAAMGLYGSWLIDPQDYTIAASGGGITGATLSNEIASTPG